MAYYDAYRNAPGWGTSNYQFVTPMQPSYQPQPNWRGRDYYQAHGGLADPDTYDYAWNRVLDHSSVGVDKEQARFCHRAAYGGLGDILHMEPIRIGAAAAYEAWRNWKYHYGVYAQPLAGDHERQREALTGLAVSEATRLWQYTGRHSDTYGRLEACESAAATADRILEQTYLLDDGSGYDAYQGRGRLSRRGSSNSLRSHSPFSPSFRSHPASPFPGDSYSMPGYVGSEGGYSPGSYSGSLYDTGGQHMRRRSYSNASYPVAYNTPMQGSSQYLQANYAPGYAGTYAPPISPAYATTPGLTVIQPPSSHHHGRSHSRHGHRSGSRHRSSSRHSRRHSVSFAGGDPYVIGSSVPYAGY